MKNHSGIDIKHIALLANLPLTEKEKKKYQEDLPKIIDYFKKISRVDTSLVTSTFNTTNLKNIFRDDKAETLFSQDQALQNAGKTEKRFIKVISDK